MANKLVRWTAVLAAGLLLAGCGARGGEGGQETPPPGEEDSPNVMKVGYAPNDDAGEPVRGGTLTFAEFSDGRNFDPSKVIPAAAAGGNAMVAIYDTLVRMNPETVEFEPRMAESVEPNEDYSEWTIKVRPGIQFSDGTPLNADAVVGSMEWYMGGQGFDVGTIAPVWSGVEKVDDMTVKITLKGGWTTFDAMLARALGMIVAPAAIAGGPDDFKPIGAGPWLVNEYKPGEHLTFKPNPNHWDGAPYLDELRFVWLGADQTKYESFTNGSVQGSYINDPRITREIADKDLPRFSEVSSAGRVVQMNHREGFPGHDLKVRQAMALALNEEEVVARSSDGQGYYGKTLFGSGSRWHHDGVAANAHDPEAAAKLVEEAKAEGFDGKVTLSGPETSKNAMLPIQSSWETAGFTVELDTIRNVSDLIAKIYVERNFGVVASGLSIQDVNPYQGLASSMDSTSASNVGGYADPEMDKLLIELRETPLDEAQDVMDRIEARYTETVPYVTYGYYTPTVVWGENVHGVMPMGTQGLTDFGKAWIQK